MDVSVMYFHVADALFLQDMVRAKLAVGGMHESRSFASLMSLNCCSELHYTDAMHGRMT